MTFRDAATNTGTSTWLGLGSGVVVADEAAVLLDGQVTAEEVGILSYVF